MRSIALSAAVASVMLAPSVSVAQGSNALVGAWELTEVIRPDGSAAENVGGLAVFTPGGHYSWVDFDGARPGYQSQAEATDAQRLLAFDTFGANAGTYTVSGSTVTRDPVAAKNPYVYAEGRTFTATFETDGKTLTLVGQNGGTSRYRRLE